MGRKDKSVLVEDTSNLALGQLMRQSRQAKGISLTEMARRLGYSVSYLSGVENCSVLPSSRLKAEYEKELELRISEQTHIIQPPKASIRSLDPHYLDLLKQGISVWNVWREEHVEEFPSLINADLSQTNLSGANFRQTNLYRADLNESNLSHTNFSKANLSRADLSHADLSGANLSGANLSGANLSGANLSGANLSGAILKWTTFGGIDLRTVKGLETVKHEGPSTIGTNTVWQSQGDLPEAFLHGAGVNDGFITYARSLVQHPIEYYTCFLSYSNRDQDFAERLYADLQSKGVRCWFAPEDMKIGDRIRHRIDESIRLYDKLLLVLSEHSVNSSWIKHEVEAALEKETSHYQIVLFPIRLDATIMEIAKNWAAHLRRTRHIGDFTKWKQHDDYQQAFERLLRDLKIET